MRMDSRCCSTVNGDSVMCVFIVILFILDVRLVGVPAGVVQWEVTQDFSTFLLRCLL